MKYIKKFETVVIATTASGLVTPNVSYITGGGGKLLILDTQTDNEELQITGTTIDNVGIEKKPKNYTISYVSAHGTKPSDKTVQEGYALTSADLPTLSDSDYTFNGWDKTVGTVVNANMTITASWTAKVTISYSSAHGTAPSAKKVDAGYALTSADLPTLSEAGYTFNGWNKSVGDIINANTTITASWSETPTPTMEFVDLGLSVKWAKWDLGASAEGEYGKYYAWGDTTGYASTEVSGKFSSGWYNTLPAASISTDLSGDNDAATVALGSGYRMPTKDEITALTGLEKTVETVGTIQGMRFTATNGNSIFIPFAGYADEGSVDYQGDFAYVWSSTFEDTGDAWHLYCRNRGDARVDNAYRYYGRSVRPVCA